MLIMKQSFHLNVQLAHCLKKLCLQTTPAFLQVYIISLMVSNVEVLDDINLSMALSTCKFSNITQLNMHIVPLKW